MTGKLGYRPDIDGLRALAILPVLWFHSDLPGLSGGFTGVDTFFVISGFLITRIIYDEIQADEFTFASFYERRVRRIGPALLTVLAATLVVGAALLLPSELLKLGESAIAGLLMVSNIYFWTEAGYFRLGEGITPLLHFWSLGVEEQFYIVFPVLLILAHRLKLVAPMVVTVFVASLALSIVATPYSPGAAFYLLPTRMWEMALGSILAVGLVKLPEKWAAISGWIGIGLIAIAAIFISKQMAFPGWVALVPCLGAGLVIASSQDASANRLLGSPILVWIGKISYSLYLWHWPVFVFMRHYNASNELGIGWSLAGIVMSVALAWLTYRFIEQPARGKRISYAKVGARLAGAAALVGFISVAAIAMQGLPSRHSPRVLALHEQRNDHGAFAKKCIAVPMERAADECQIGEGPTRVAVWGDSHAAALIDGVAGAFAEPTIVYAKNSCPPSDGWTNPGLSLGEANRCNAHNSKILERLASDEAVHTVVLSGYWASHARQGDAALWRGVASSAEVLRARGKRVIILAGVPEPGEDVPWASAIRERFGRAGPELECPAAKVPVNSAYEIVDLSQAFCDYPQSNLLFSDHNHPSLTANKQVVTPQMARALVTAGD